LCFSIQRNSATHDEGFKQEILIEKENKSTQFPGVSTVYLSNKTANSVSSEASYLCASQTLKSMKSIIFID
jgi:hypothetical protein